MRVGDTYRLRNGEWAMIIESKEFTFKAVVNSNPTMKIIEFSKETLNSLESKEFDAMEIRKKNAYGGV